MNRDALLVGLGVAFVTLLALSVLVWAAWVRPFLKASGARTASPYSLVALVADLATGLIYSRGAIHWSLKLLGVLLTLLASALIIFILVLFLGS